MLQWLVLAIMVCFLAGCASSYSSNIAFPHSTMLSAEGYISAERQSSLEAAYKVQDSEISLASRAYNVNISLSELSREVSAAPDDLVLVAYSPGGPCQKYWNENKRAPHESELLYTDIGLVQLRFSDDRTRFAYRLKLYSLNPWPKAYDSLRSECLLFTNEHINKIYEWLVASINFQPVAEHAFAEDVSLDNTARFDYRPESELQAFGAGAGGAQSLRLWAPMGSEALNVVEHPNKSLNTSTPGSRSYTLYDSGWLAWHPDDYTISDDLVLGIYKTEALQTPILLKDAIGHVFNIWGQQNYSAARRLNNWNTAAPEPILSYMVETNNTIQRGDYIPESFRRRNFSDDDVSRMKKVLNAGARGKAALELVKVGASKGSKGALPSTRAFQLAEDLRRSESDPRLPMGYMSRLCGSAPAGNMDVAKLGHWQLDDAFEKTDRYFQYGNCLKGVAGSFDLNLYTETLNMVEAIWQELRKIDGSNWYGELTSEEFLARYKFDYQNPYDYFYERGQRYINYGNTMVEEIALRDEEIRRKSAERENQRQQFAAAFNAGMASIGTMAREYERESRESLQRTLQNVEQQNTSLHYSENRQAEQAVTYSSISSQQEASGNSHSNQGSKRMVQVKATNSASTTSSSIQSEDTRHCITTEVIRGDDCGASTSLRLEKYNACDIKLYVQNCVQRENLSWSCGSSYMAPRSENSYYVCDSNGEYLINSCTGGYKACGVRKADLNQ
jgi:hypothetical protein